MRYSIITAVSALSAMSAGAAIIPVEARAVGETVETGLQERQFVEAFLIGVAGGVGTVAGTEAANAAFKAAKIEVAKINRNWDEVSSIFFPPLEYHVNI